MLGTDHQSYREGGKKALVTGASGFIGSHLVDHLLSKGWRVIGVDRRSPTNDPIARLNLMDAVGNPLFHFLHADIAEPCLRGFLDVGVVFHLAAATGVRSSWDANFTGYMHDNIAATHHLVQECERAGVPRLVLASSSSVYGTAALPSKEDGQVRPMSPYGVSKLASEQLALAYAARGTGSTSTVALRFFTVYGPRQRPDMAIHRMLNAIHTGTPMRLYGDGRQRRNFTFVDDVIEAIVQSALTQQAGQAVNIAGPASVTMRTVIDIVEDVTGKPVPIIADAARCGDPEATEADSSLAREVLGYSPCVDLADGIARQWQWTLDTHNTPAIGSIA
ncbi:NAD-dependent epimerase/dehydratase family protein [Streptomyces sp. NBC_00868]|uniref:NAD-dependent epimerase/dehydratase family protein n=1 Tax=unclassified Streptomyces TaxID=2593676 RepID=UPI0032564652|nr:NAD-dependent epimerase/dehydratase family protein [Streptomyces sp. NBC_00868]